MLRSVVLAIFIFCCSLSQLSYADEIFIHRKDVQEFIQLMVKKYKFKKEELVSLFTQVKLRPQVIHHINKPLEKEPWHLYQMLFVNEWRIQHGVRFWNKYAAALQEAEKTFGVPAAIIVATIGIETKYGQRIGGYRVIDSLTNLAFSESPRAPFFRKELTEFLLLTRDEHLDPLKVMGSYAGAIGQPQFMPSSYRYYAINFSRSGRTDLMNDEIDVIGSIANYYKKHGWKYNEPIAIPAMMIGSRYNYFVRGNTKTPTFTVSTLAKYGLVPKNKLTREQSHQPVQVIELDNRYTREYWLGFHNFNVIKRYNPSDWYAMSIYQLSYYISALKKRLDHT